MTQPYGQQPGNYGQTGGYPQQQGGYPQSPPGGFPQPGGYQQSGGYPQAPAYTPGSGGLPSAPQDYGDIGSTVRPGSATAAAVLAFVQGGITAVTTIIMLAGAAQSDTSSAGIGWLLVLAQAVGVVLLIVGGVQLMGGKGRTILIVGDGLEIAISLFYIIVFSLIPTFGVSEISAGKTFLVLVAIAFAVMPAISLIMASGGATTQFLNARRGR